MAATKLYHWKKHHKNKSNPDHLSHAHLWDGEGSQAAGRDVYKSPVVKIVDVSVGLVKSRESPDGEEMNFLHFAGQSKKLGLNTTNCKTMEAMTGRVAPPQWIGTTIQLYVDPKAQYPGGKKGPAIRIKPMAAKGAPETEPLAGAPEAVAERLEEERAERLESDEGASS